MFRTRACKDDMDQMVAKTEALHTAMPLDFAALKQLVAAKRHRENTVLTDARR